MALTFPDPFPNEAATNRTEQFRFGRNLWRQMQKFRSSQFTWAPTVPSGVLRKTFQDVSAGGADVGFDNLKVGMWITVTPPATIDQNIQVDYAFVPAAGQLTVQLRNLTGAPIAVASATWAYLGYTF